MIKKEEAKKLGIKVQEQKDTLEQKNAKLIEKLKSLIPNIINSDGTLDIKALKDAIDISHTTSKNQGYELTFAGKGLARWIAGIPTKKELKTEKEESKNFETTRNVLIRGDNLDVLKILYQNYHNKIKMIYIDPPYNTKSDEFIYKDNFKKSEQELIEECGIEEEEIDFLQNIYGTKTHSGWLSFMYPRLKLARDLLREDGVIFISIDDNEQANLKIMCDEIFGESNFVASLHLEMSTTQGMKVNSALKGDIVKNAEYCLVYANSKQKIEFSSLYSSKEWDTHYSIYYNRKKNIHMSLFRFLQEQKEIANLPDSFQLQDIPKHYSENDIFRKYIHGIAENIYRDNNCDITLKLLEEQKKLLNKSKIVEYTHHEKVYFLKKTSTGIIRQLLPLSIAIGNTDGFNNQHGLRKIRGDWWSDYYKDMMNINKEGGIIFKNGKKPIRLLKDILKISTKQNDLILDFFAGSGTTGDAVMRLNAEENGNRKFILVQWDEKINPKKNKEAHEFCIKNNLSPVISSICLERLNHAGEKIKREHQNKFGIFSSSEGLDIGYKVFSLKDKPEIGGEDEIFKLKNKRQSTWDTLYNMLCATGKLLDTPIQEIQKDILYECDNEIYLIGITDREVFENYRNHKINIDGYAEIDLESFLNIQVTTRENLNIIF